MKGDDSGYLVAVGNRNRAFIERDSELQVLLRDSRRVVDGGAAVVLVRGEIGAGKSTLLEKARTTFLDDLWSPVVLEGRCDTIAGVSGRADPEPFQPFRSILDDLVNAVPNLHSDPSRRVAVARVGIRALMEFGPDLIGSLVPASSLAIGIGKYFAGERKLADKLAEKMAASARHGAIEDLVNPRIEQLLRVVESVAQATPIALFLDDLQWAHPATLNLFFRVGRNLLRPMAPTRLLLVGAYRSNRSLSLSDDPLEEIQNNLVRSGAKAIDLDSISEHTKLRFCRELLDREPNCIDDEFIRRLALHTGGNPLFVEETLELVRSSGGLTSEDGVVRLAKPVIWVRMPVRVGATVQERVRVLPSATRSVLNIASVLGYEFTAEDIAAVAGLGFGAVADELDRNLVHEHHLVRGIGADRFAGSSRYRFNHGLVRQFVYDDLGRASAKEIHKQCLKVLGADVAWAKGRPLELAWHATQSGEISEAVHWTLAATGPV